MPKRRAKVSKERQVDTYAEMWHASRVMLEKGKSDPEGSYYQWMASLVFFAFALEAYLNHIGQIIFRCWTDLEQLAPSKKLNCIAEKLGIEKDDSKRPFQTVAELFKFRNYIAHGKSVFLKSEEEALVDLDEASGTRHDRLETQWERYCTLENAERAKKDVESIIRMLDKSAGMKDDPLSGIRMTWSSSTTLLPEKEQST